MEDIIFLLGFCPIILSCRASCSWNPWQEVFHGNLYTVLSLCDFLRKERPQLPSRAWAACDHKIQVSLTQAGERMALSRTCVYHQSQHSVAFCQHENGQGIWEIRKKTCFQMWHGVLEAEGWRGKACIEMRVGYWASLFYF